MIKDITPGDRIGLLETAANELIDSSILEDKKVLLWKNIKEQLVQAYGKDKRKLDNLNEIDRSYFPDKKKSSKSMIVKKSSRGNNHFGR